jgi:hypothetical protein
MDQNNRILHYVEVIYFDGINYRERKSAHYIPNEANAVYMKTVEKIGGQAVIITLREENHNLLKSHSGLKKKK